jgi:3-oxoacyl-[acyl-carrier-protein] synthase II
MQSVAVTGIGLVTPLGLTAEENLLCLRTMQSGISPLTAFEVDARIGRTAAQVADFDLIPYLRFPKSSKFMNRPLTLGMKAAIDAFRSAGLEPGQVPREQLGIFIGAGNTCLEPAYFAGPLSFAWGDKNGDRDYKHLGGRPMRMIDRYFSLRTLANAGVGMLSNELQAQGPNANYVHSETASLMALQTAWYEIAEGRCTVAVAGGYDSLIQPTTYLDFASRGLLSAASPDCAYRPFDRRRDGIVLGEAGAFFILENAEHAAQRGVPILGEVIDVDCALTDQADMTARLSEGRQIDYLVARGFGTQEDDLTEAEALAPFDAPVTALKSRTGYLGAATAVAESALGLMAAREGFLPPVARLVDPEEDCTLDLVKTEVRQLDARQPVGLFLTVSLAGQCGGIVLKAVGA